MKKRKTDLFRFVTHRTPELISSDRKVLGFINHPDATIGVFMPLVDDNNVLGSRVAVGNAALTFTPYARVQELKDQIPEVWDFSIWLAKNKNSLVRSEIDALVPTALPTTGEILTIWDNVFYDIITNANPYVRQACLQIIVGLNFIDKYTTYSPGITTVQEEIDAEAALLKRLANGKVIVHRVFSLEKQELVGGALDFNPASNKSLKKQHYANLANCKMLMLGVIHTELCGLQKQYKLDRDAEFDKQMKAYKAVTDPILEQYIASNRKTVLAEEDIPEDLFPPFKFTFNEPFSDSYINGKLSVQALDYVKSNCLEFSTLTEAIDLLEKSISQAKIEASQSGRKNVSKVLINGVLTKMNRAKRVHDYAFSFEPDKYNEAPGDYRMYLSLDAGYEGAYLMDFTFDLTIGSRQFSMSEYCPKLLCVNNQIIFIELFQDSALSFLPCESLFFTATLTLDNGKQIKIYKKGTSNVFLYTGAAIAIIPSNGPVEHYGVNRIGVADYRRVEQELCCYVPGEVSHIENILAREYKEKSSRNLTRSEITFETTTEREVEDLTDTTSTSRFEMSTEISEVLQKDKSQNFGFDTSVNGDYGTTAFSAGGYGDFSFAQSATDSNSQAKTYAEDVTKRALERIVQKTTVKRTSKIIREYEENNKHGFDNREGTQHVTGVYRWIDKVYKNRIVNYGKRLMYEFMIPEPARWYKEAIIVQAEEEEVTTPGGGSTGTPNIAVKPTPLSENGINSASDITRENYQSIAALYGASPDAPLDASTNVEISGSNSPGTGDSEKSFSHTGFTVPQNYVGASLVGSVNFHFKANTGANAYMNVTVAGKNFSVSGLENEHDWTLPVNATGLNVTGTVSASLVMKKVTTYTLSAQLKCTLQPQLYQQWQQDTYNVINGKYQEKLQAFNDAQTAASVENVEVEKPEEGSSVGRNPLFNAGIIHTELKRLCIEMLAKPFGFEQGKNFYTVAKCDVPELVLTKSLDVYSSHVKFFEQAFDWDLMSKFFYPYYWADKCDWKDLFQALDGNDYFFQQFLQSGMGRVVLPVREGFEDAVTFFMETGKIWSGTGLVVDTDDDLYVSIVDEMTHVQGVVEGEEWETIVPSTLTIVQALSVKLTEGGLPCCETDPVVIAELNIEEDTTILTRDTGTTTTP